MVKRLRTIVVIGGILFSGLAQAALVGNDIIDRSILDTAVSISFIDTNAIFSSSGVIDEWTIYSKRAGDIYLQAFRNTGGNNYQLVGQNFFSGISTGVESFNIGVADQISVIAGDVMGWSFTDPSIVPFTSGGNSVRWTGGGNIMTGIGAIGDFSGSGSRTYSINANLTTSAVPAPAAFWLIGSGLIGLVGMRKNSKKHA